MPDEKNIQEVDYSKLPDIDAPATEQVDVSTLPDIAPEQQPSATPPLQGPVDIPDIQQRAAAPLPETQAPIQFVSPEEQAARLQPASSTIQPPVSEAEQAFLEKDLALKAESDQVIEQNFSNVSERTGIPIQNIKDAAQILRLAPIHAEGLTFNAPGADVDPEGKAAAHYSSAFARGLYTGVGEAANMLAGAHSAIQGALDLPKKVNPFRDVAEIYLEGRDRFTEAPDDALGDVLFSAGAILPDIALSHYALPNMASAQLARLTAGAVKSVPKFATFLAAKEGFGTFEETGDVAESMKSGLEGFKTGLWYQALGITSGEVGKIATKMAQNELAGTALDISAASILFGTSGMAETGQWDARTFASGAGIGIGFGIPKAKGAIERTAAKKVMGSYFTSTPELEAEAREVKKTNKELRSEAIDLRIEAMSETDPGIRNQLLIRAAKLENVIGIRATTEMIKQSPEEFIEAIQNDKSLSQEAADYYVKKVQDTFLESNEDIAKVKPQLKEVEKLNKKNAAIDQMEVSETEKEVLKSKNNERLQELATEIESVFKTEEQIKKEASEAAAEKVTEEKKLPETKEKKVPEKKPPVEKKPEPEKPKPKEDVTKKELPKDKEPAQKPSEKERGKPEGKKPVEPGKEKVPEVEEKRTEAEAEKTPILVKSGASVFGIDLDNKAAISLWKKHFTARGHLPGRVFDNWVKSQGKVRRQLTKAHKLVNDFNKALKKTYGLTKTLDANVSKEQIDKLNTALSNLGVDGNKIDVFKEIPEQLHAPLIKMRNHIDALSRELVRSGLVEGELEAKFQENLGFYMTRTYRAHSDPKWTWDNIPEPVVNRAISFIRAEFPKLSEGKFTSKEIIELNKIESTPEADRTKEQNSRLTELNMKDIRITGMLQKMLLKDGPLGTLAKGGKLGAKDLGVMMKIKNIPVEIRDFLGEYRDPAYNYSTSVAKMAELLERHKFLEEVKKEGTKGKNKFLSAQPEGKLHVPIVGEGDPRFAPLSWRAGFEGKEGERVELRKAYHTTPEIAEAFQTFQQKAEMGKLMRGYVKYLNVPVKYGKTILSPVTHARNYYANYLFHVANGRVFEKPTGAMAKAHKTIFQDLAKSSDKDFRVYLERLVELNVIGESTRAGEVHDIVKDAEYLQEFDKRGDNVFKKAGRKTLRGLEKLYQVEDDVHKIIAFESERARYEPIIKKQNPKATPEELAKLSDAKAAEIVRKTMPTYSLVPEVIKGLRRIPLVGTFVSFPAEVIRTTGNTLALAASEMKSPDTRAIGAKRIAGIMTAAGITGAASTLSRWRVGMDKKEEKDFRRFVAPWSKNSDLMILTDKGGGVYTYVDVGFSDPYNYLKKPITAMLKGDDMEAAAWEGIVQLVEPFLGEELLASRILDINRNKKKDSGDQVFNPQDDPGDRNAAKLKYLWGGVQPGAIYTGKRIARSFKKDVNEYGRGLTPKNELMNLFLGVRSNDLDVKRSMSFKLRRGGTDLKNAFDIYNKTIWDKQMSDEDRNKKLKSAEKSVGRVMSELHKDYKAAINLGVPEDDLNKMIKKMYVGPYPAHVRVEKAIMSGDFPGIDPESGKLKSSGGGKLFGK